MRNLKRVLSLALALVMVLGMMVITTSAADFTDADEITNTEAVEVLAAIGIVEGTNGAFNPKGTFTREAAAKLITYMLGYDKVAKNLSAEGLFTDVEADRWSAGFIAFCASRGYITGVGDGKFNPDGILKDVELGKLVLCAIGYDPAKYEGAGWDDAVSIDLLQAGLVSEVTKQPITREDACAMILAAMTWTDGGDIYTVYNDIANVGVVDATEVIKVYTDAVDAYFTASALRPTMPNVKVDVDTSDDYLLNTVYGVDAGSVADIYGRPGSSYALNDDYGTVLKYSRKPVATFTGTVSEKDFFAEIGATGALSVSNSNRFITMNKITEDGRQWNDSGVGPAASIEIENNDRSAVPGTGEGITVEVYATRAKNVYEMVCIREYSATVTGISEADATAKTPRMVTITTDVNPLGYGKSWTYVTDEFAFGDTVICTLAEVNGAISIQTVEPAEYISGKVTKITDGTVYTIGGEDYVLSQLNVCGAPSLNDSGAWYVDSMGNLIAVKNADFTPWNYGYLIAYDYQQKVTDGTLLGNGSKAAAEKFEIITTESKKVVFDGAFTVDNYGVVTDWQWDANTDFAAVTGDARNYSLSTDHLVRYTLNADGVINEIESIIDAGLNTAGQVEASGGGQTATKGAAQFGTTGKYVTDETIFFVYHNDRDFAIYTGYKNIPLTVATTNVGSSKDWEFFYAVDKDGDPVNSTIAAVMLNVTDAGAQTAATYAYVASPAMTSEITNDGTVYTYTNVYLNGTKGTLAFEDTDPSAQAGTLYTYTTDTKTGYATLGSSVGTKTGATEITAIQSSYFVAGSAQYFDADTVFYQVDNVTGAVAEVEGLPALNPAYDVKMIFASSNSVSSAADVVYFVVIAK